YGSSLGIERLRRGADHFAPMALGTLDILSNGFARYRERIAVEQMENLLHRRGHPAGIVKILHEKFTGGLYVGDIRSAARNAIEVFEVERNTQPPGDGQQVNDCIRRPADRHVDG